MSVNGSEEIPQELFAGGGEMGALIRSHDWSLSPLGAVEEWSQSLKTAIGLVLGSPYPMLFWWGHQMINLYNDAYIPILGKRHPQALGDSAKHTTWPAIIAGNRTVGVGEVRLLWIPVALYDQQGFFIP